jgi:indolepyruvate ferredoxin oxidoreductase
MAARRVAFLTEYQNAAYAARYRGWVERVAKAEEAVLPGARALTDAVARYLFKLMAYKDEYEVGRLYSSGDFRRQVAATFEGEKLRYEFHLAPPIFGRKNPDGTPKKTSFGPWMMGAFGLLAKLKGLRGTAFDIFGYTDERRTERRLIADYEAMLEEITAKLKIENHATAVALAQIPEKIRGFGHVKERHLHAAKAEEAALLARFRSPVAAMQLAAE